MDTRESRKEEKTERRWVSPEKLEERVLGKISDLFATIGNPSRLVTLYELRKHDPTGMKWKEIQEISGVSGGSLKFHMDKLEAFSLVRGHRGRYHITSKGLGLLHLVDLLKDKVEAELRVELEQYKDFLWSGASEVNAADIT